MSCPAVEEKPLPGETVTCELVDKGSETYRVVLKSETAKERIFEFTQSSVNLWSADGAVLFPKGLLEEQSKVRLECASQRRYLRVALDKPGYCKITGSDEYLRVQLDDVETEKWSHGRVKGPATRARSIVSRAHLDATITCSELALADRAPARCAIRTTSGEQFEMTYALGDPRTELARDGSPVVVLPGALFKGASSERIPLQCPHRVARPDEAVHCSFLNGNKQSPISISVDAEGNVRLL